MSSIVMPSWATVDPLKMGKDATPYAVSNLVGGKWASAASTMSIPHPLDKDAHDIFTIPDTQVDELGPFFESLRKVPKSGVHNPLKNPDRYVKYGEISRKVN
jgi:1-pyrroline-5-carboxylate dehydrogenase